MTNHYQGSTNWIAAVDESEARRKAEQLINGEHFELVQVGIFSISVYQIYVCGIQIYKLSLSKLFLCFKIWLS
jgi:hypothetical protein